MAICVSIKDLRDTAKFTELVKTSDAPITVTKNGYDEFVAIKSEDYEDLCKAEAKAQLLERMLIAEHERQQGISEDAFDNLSRLKDKYGL